MINLILGILVGVLMTSVGLSILEAYGGILTVSVSTNIVIAIATIVAVFLHNSSMNHQKESRVWEVNKDILLKLSHSLSELMEQTSKLCDNEFNEQQHLPPEHDIDNDYNVFKRFSKNISDSLYVYKPLLSQELVKSIEKYQLDEKNIDHAVDIAEINHFEAYDGLHGYQKDLHKVLSNEIKKTAKI